MHKFFIEIISPEKKIYSGEILTLIAQTKTGEITVLANHIPMISLLSVGKVQIKISENEEKTFYLNGGSLEVRSKEEGVVILTDEILDVENLEESFIDQKVENAKNLAKEAMQKDDEQFAVFEGELEKYIYLQKILKNKK
jgi:F-type H+-transporting ATPase subunit epsilon